MSLAEILRLDPDSGVPPYRQLLVLLREAASSGALPPGTRLPAVRQLATDLGLAANTVARAYRELEQAGVLVTRGRHGTLVADVAAADSRTAQLRLAADAYLDIAQRLGADAEESLDGVRRAIELRRGSSLA